MSPLYFSVGDKTQGALKRFSAHPHPEGPLCGAIRGCQPASTHCQGNAASQRGLKSLEPVGNGAGRAEIGGLPDACTHRLSLGPGGELCGVKVPRKGGRRALRVGRFGLDLGEASL